MSEIDDGGQAFPKATYDFNRDGVVLPYQEDGMTLRDYAAVKFAAAWVIAIVGRSPREPDGMIAMEANRLGLLQADEMIAARSQP